MGRAYQNRKESMAKTSDQKAKVYSKLSREIYVCAKAGGPDPVNNAALKVILDRAKKDQVPSHVIERAIDKAKGTGGEDFAPARYEGFGPAGCMVIVECLTDNPTRTFNEVRAAFGRAGARLGNAGSVAHMFDHCGILAFSGHDEDTVLEALLAADVDVTDVEQDGRRVTVFVPSTEYGKAKKALDEGLGAIDFDVDEIQFIPQNTVALGGEDAQALARLLALLDDLDDVQSVYHSATTEE